MAIYTYVGLYRGYNANNNFESVAVVNVAKDGYSPKGKYNIETLNAHLGIRPVTRHLHIWSRQIWNVLPQSKEGAQVVAFFNAELEPKVQHLVTKDEYRSKMTFRRKRKQFRL